MHSLLLAKVKSYVRPLQVILRNLCSEGTISGARIERLRDRTLISVSGQDALVFLQSLMTNDLNLLLKEKDSIYSLMLNYKGRVIHEAFIYKTMVDTKFLIETDTNSCQAMKVHLSLYQKTKKISVANEEHNYSVWVIYKPLNTNNKLNPSVFKQELYNHNDLGFIEEIDFGDNVIVCHDPRILSLGVRIIAPKKIDIAQYINEQGYNLHQGKIGEYKLLRYNLGISEGVNEIMYGKCSPRELNCDFLNALSNKKEFLGSDKLKTANNNKYRIMPIKLQSNKIKTYPINTPIVDFERRKKSPIGYLRGMQGVCGIALVKITTSFENMKVRMGNVLGQCEKPFWWPAINQCNPTKYKINNT